MPEGKTIDDRSKLNHYTFWPGFLLLLAGITLGLIYEEGLATILGNTKEWIHINFGWLEVSLGIIIVMFTIGIAFSQSETFGSAARTPSPNSLSGSGLPSLSAVASVSEYSSGHGRTHLSHDAAPLSLHIDPGSKDAGVFAIAQTTLHWTIAQYCFYTICGVAIALVSYNRNAPLSVAAGMYALFPKKWHPVLAPTVHAICLFSLCCAIATSMVPASCRSEAEQENLRLHPRPTTWAAAAAIIIPIYVISSYSGLKKACESCPREPHGPFFFFMALVLFMGPTLFILGIGVESFGYFANNFFRNSTLLNTMQINDTWPMQWLVPYMEIFFIFAPLLGHFLARMGKGRTIRQFILVNIIPPTIFCHFWIATFGGTAVFFQWSGLVDVWTGIHQYGMESMVYILLSQFPFSKILMGIFVVTIVFSFATMTDSLVATLAIISTKGVRASEEPPKRLKIVWGVVTGLIAYVLCACGGIEPVRGLISLAGFPMMIFTFAMCISLVKDGIYLLNKPNWLDNKTENS